MKGQLTTKIRNDLRIHVWISFLVFAKQIHLLGIGVREDNCVTWSTENTFDMSYAPVYRFKEFYETWRPFILLFIMTQATVPTESPGIDTFFGVYCHGVIRSTTEICDLYIFNDFLVSILIFLNEQSYASRRCLKIVGQFICRYEKLSIVTVTQLTVFRQSKCVQFLKCKFFICIYLFLPISFCKKKREK